jgi:predicted XRE-type DNA-binding protein
MDSMGGIPPNPQHSIHKEYQMSSTIYQDQEVWKSIEDYEGLYEVSSHGRVRSLDRLDGRGHRRKGKMLKLFPNRGGYYKVELVKNGKHATRAVHRLVARAFCEGYAEGLDVCHNDGNKLNNHYTNLRWDTRKGNMTDKVKHGTTVDQKGEQNHRSKLTAEQVLEIRRLYATGDYTQKQLGEMFGVTRTMIGDIVNRKNWTHI